MRALLAIAMIAVTGLTVALVVVANDDTSTGTSPSVTLPPPADTATPGDVRYDGGPEEGTRSLAQPAPIVPATGGASDNTRDPVKDYSQNGATGDVAPANPETRYDGGPEEGTRGPGN
jgi:hypothetical protein